MKLWFVENQSTGHGIVSSVVEKGEKNDTEFLTGRVTKGLVVKSAVRIPVEAMFEMQNKSISYVIKQRLQNFIKNYLWVFLNS